MEKVFAKDLVRLEKYYYTGGSEYQVVTYLGCFLTGLFRVHKFELKSSFNESGKSIIDLGVSDVPQWIAPLD
jgi:hypothetical protein